LLPSPGALDLFQAEFLDLDADPALGCVGGQF
jgi:hypothetical protein